MNEILNVLQKPMYDESIVKREYHSYSPYLKSFNNNDEIRIPIQNQDLFVLPSESLIYIHGFIVKKEATKEVPAIDVKLKNNFASYLFDEIRYEINGFEVDRTRKLGISSIMKNFVSLNKAESDTLKNAGWSLTETYALVKSHFSCCIPLKMLLGFAEDYNKILLNSKHELILQRSTSDERSYYSTNATDQLKLTILDITWKMPHIQLSDFAKLEMFKIINSKHSIPIAFRSWDCHVNPVLPKSTKVLWNVKLSPQNERPRFLIIGLQKEKSKEEGNIFDHCNISNLKVYLNSESYPYDDLNNRFEMGQYSVLYNMYAKFQQSFYMREPEPLLNVDEYKTYAPLIVVDVSHQNEAVKIGPIDVRIEFDTEASKPIPDNTSAYCLVIHDRLIEYSPLTSEIRKII